MMKKGIQKLTLSFGSAAVALSLLLIAGSAVALPKSSGTPASLPAIALASNTLTPAAPASSKLLHASEEDIRDIRQPRRLPSCSPWVAVATGIISLALAFAASRWMHRRASRALLPHEVALHALEQARSLMNPDSAREYCFTISQIIRCYLEEQYRVHAPRQTTEEFLRELVEVRDTMLASHRALLGDFLQHCDLAKFAGWHYSLPDLEAMHASAETFVQQTVQSSAAVPPAATIEGYGVPPLSGPTVPRTT
jgi:hypothetical protein